MSMNDPLGDMLTRIRNGQMAHKKAISVRYSRLHERVLDVLKEEGFIREYKSQVIAGDRSGNKKEIIVELKYAEGRGAIREIGRVSKPGRRVYSGPKDMTRYYSGLGMFIVSTPQGVMTDHTARDANIGGEVLCKVF